LHGPSNGRDRSRLGYGCPACSRPRFVDKTPAFGIDAFREFAILGHSRFGQNPHFGRLRSDPRFDSWLATFRLWRRALSRPRDRRRLGRINRQFHIGSATVSSRPNKRKRKRTPSRLARTRRPLGTSPVRNRQRPTEDTVGPTRRRIPRRQSALGPVYQLLGNPAMLDEKGEITHKTHHAPDHAFFERLDQLHSSHGKHDLNDRNAANLDFRGPSFPFPKND